MPNMRHRYSSVKFDVAMMNKLVEARNHARKKMEAASVEEREAWYAVQRARVVALNSVYGMYGMNSAILPYSNLAASDPDLVASYLEGEGVPDLYRPQMNIDEAKKVASADPRVVARKKGLARLKEFLAAAKLGKSFVCHSPRMEAAIVRANSPCPDRLAREYAAL